jgi:NAD(P)-dependent dehydrogenase (short-subunit alcohol dehydrogenase family)
VLGVTRAAAHELAGAGITVNAVRQPSMIVWFGIEKKDQA